MASGRPVADAMSTVSPAGLVVAVVGPTATGKSDLALDLAQALDAEVVNADALQLYRGLDIGTAKVPQDERRGVPHHLLDVLEPEQDASVAAYQEQGRGILDALAARGRRAVVVGGSGLYVRALLDEMEFPGADPRLRADLEDRLEREGSRALHAQLAQADPAAAEAIGPRNGRRLVRALEVLALTGVPSSGRLPQYRSAIASVQLGLDCDRPTLDARISSRVARMWAAGLVEEVAAIGPERIGRTAAHAVGYAQVLALLRGELDDEAARASTVAGTRRLARKQMGWFGRDPRVHWLRAGDDDLLAQALRVVAAADERGPDEPDGLPPTRRTLGS